MENVGRGLTFVAGSIVGGLALAFVIVLLRPELIRPTAHTAADGPPAASSTPGGGTAAGNAAPRTAPVGSSRLASAAPERVTYSAAVERAAPSVVNIYTARRVTERVVPSTLGELFGGFLPRYRNRVESSLGSGVIVDADGHIVTNHHVIAQAESVKVQLADGRVAEARIVGRDPDTDLAVLKIDLQGLPVATLGHSDQLKVGDVVLAIGCPFGLSQTVTHGIVSATSRQQLGIAALEDFIQTDAPINFGNSGGALVDSDGALVGINTAILAKNLGVEGIGFAIPVNMVRGVVSDIIAHGYVVRGWIGIVPEDLTDDQARPFGLVRGGVVVAQLYRGSPAQEAGLQPGDLLLSLDGKPVTTAQDALGRIATRKPGAKLALHILRGTAELDLRAQVGEQPQGD